MLQDTFIFWLCVYYANMLPWLYPNLVICIRQSLYFVYWTIVIRKNHRYICKGFYLTSKEIFEAKNRAEWTMIINLGLWLEFKKAHMLLLFFNPKGI